MSGYCMKSFHHYQSKGFNRLLRELLTFLHLRISPPVRLLPASCQPQAPEWLKMLSGGNSLIFSIYFCSPYPQLVPQGAVSLGRKWVHHRCEISVSSDHWTSNVKQVDVILRKVIIFPWISKLQLARSLMCSKNKISPNTLPCGIQ